MSPAATRSWEAAWQRRAPRQSHLCQPVRARARRDACRGITPQGPRGARGRERRPARPEPDHRLHLHAAVMSETNSDGNQPATEARAAPGPNRRARRTSTGLDDAQLQQLAQEIRELIIDVIGEIGGHFGANLGDLRARRRPSQPARLPARQDPLGRRPPGLPAQGPDRAPRPARHHPPVRRPRSVLLDLRVRARHHGRRPRLDLDRLRGRAEGGDAQGHRRGRQRRRGDRRRSAHRRRRLRGAPQRRRARRHRSSSS